jgi:hypothetical protein
MRKDFYTILHIRGGPDFGENVKRLKQILRIFSMNSHKYMIGNSISRNVTGFMSMYMMCRSDDELHFYLQSLGVETINACIIT